MRWWLRPIEVPDLLQKTIAWVIPGVFLAALVVSHLAKGERRMGVGYLLIGLVWVPLVFLVWQDEAQVDEQRSS